MTHVGTILVTAAQMRAAAHQLAASLEAGEFEGINPARRCELRHLACQTLAWADAIDPERAPHVPVESGTVLRFPAPAIGGAA
jgi:hypothetical protein